MNDFTLVVECAHQPSACSGRVGGEVRAAAEAKPLHSRGAQPPWRGEGSERFQMDGYKVGSMVSWRFQWLLTSGRSPVIVHAILSHSRDSVGLL